MLATCITDEMLVRLFQRHFADHVAALLRLERHLASIPLSFNLKTQLRELPYPPTPGHPNGVPSLIYYFLPDSGWGSDKQVPANPLDPNFVKATDGIGLNLGCPVRLLRALDVLAQLRPEDQKEIKDSLLNPTQHLATIEELLWPTVWKSPSELRRGGTIPRARGNVDWALKSGGFPLYIEAKFRPSGWPGLSDQGTFTPIVGSFLDKAEHKFPNPPHEAALYLVGITTYANLTDAILHQIGQELETHRQVHAVIFRTLMQMTHVLSLDLGVRDKILSLLAKPSVKDYPTNYSIFFHIEQRNTRLVERAKNNKKPGETTTHVFCWHLRPQFDTPIIIPRIPYRLNIASRRPDGEPQFEVIAK